MESGDSQRVAVPVFRQRFAAAQRAKNGDPPPPESCGVASWHQRSEADTCLSPLFARPDVPGRGPPPPRAGTGRLRPRMAWCDRVGGCGHAATGRKQFYEHRFASGGTTVCFLHATSGQAAAPEQRLRSKRLAEKVHALAELMGCGPASFDFAADLARNLLCTPEKRPLPATPGAVSCGRRRRRHPTTW